ncbi:hypothetical protein [Prolixibacter sp. SD074]|jgi:hypothetical protein|uniref:hypothetical protein n=1 Tax=Prolixibacter sp. SD074 TaxID=2652391 RepID=UPI001276A63D|nr:hypothetical protein [Prolixibacter sp. SD074]GET29956.1 hypothetical protein SD074_21580 [Prolixibacter sp. SD074]
MHQTNNLTFNLFICFFLLPTTSIFAQSDFAESDSYSISVGGASVTLQTPFAAFYNQAGLAGLEKLSAAVYYQQRYMTSDFAEMSGVFCLPLRTGTFALSVWQTGITGYHQNRFGLAFAKKLGPRLSGGLQFSYYMMDFPENGTARGVVLFEMGARYEFPGKQTLGVHLFNPFDSHITSNINQRTIPPELKIGAEFPIGGQLKTFVATSGDWSGNWMLHGGFDFQPHEHFSLRGGISGKPLNYAVGIGYRWNFLQTGLAVLHRDVLGYSPSISLTFNL